MIGAHHVLHQLFSKSLDRKDSRGSQTSRVNASSKELRILQNPIISRSFLSFRDSGKSGLERASTTRRYFFFGARNAIYHSLHAALLLPGDEVLIPAYVCKVVPEAVLGYGSRVVFYGVDRECRPDFSDLEARIGARTRALIVVHYFGFPQPITRLRELSDRHNLFLIEDCAHVLRSKIDGRPIGSCGDASVFSLRKFFPLYDGGELVLNRPQADVQVEWGRESALVTLKVAKDLVDQVAEHATHPLIRIPYLFLQRLKKPLLRFVQLRSWNSGGMTVEKTDATFDASLVNQPMSRLSKIVFRHSDVSAVVAKRRANYLYLQTKLAAEYGLRFLISALPDDICPWVFPLFFDGVPDACSALRDRGLPAVSWDGVRPNGVEWGLFSDADYLYRNLVFLPVHQNLAAEDLEEIIVAVRQIASV
jgi:perosamine synthetase